MRQGRPGGDQRADLLRKHSRVPGRPDRRHSDGVAVVPYARAQEVLDLVKQLIGRERARIEEIQKGALFRSDVDDTLRKKGVID